MGAVRAAQPGNAQKAANLASQLCRFLAARPRVAWDQATEPDLRALLKDEAIVAHTAKGARGARNSRSTARQYLRELARAVNGVERNVIAPVRKAPRDVRRYWPVVADAGPFTVLLAGFAAGEGSLRGDSWSQLDGELRVEPMWLSAANDQVIVIAETTANTGVLGNVAGVQASAAALRDASDATIEVSTIESTRTSASVPDGGSARPLSRAEAVRRAKAARVARTTALTQVQDPKPVVVAALPTLGADIADAILRYRSQAVTAQTWQRVATAVRAGMTAYSPPNAKEVTSKGTWLTRYCAWLLGRPERLCEEADLQVTELLDRDLVETYVTDHMAGGSGRSRATARSILRRVVRNLTPGEGPESLGATAVQPPYTPIECDRFRRLARNQPTAALRRSLSAVVALGLGAGLSAEESKAVTPRHVRTVDLGERGKVLAVDVPGRNARTTVVREQYVELLQDALDLHARARRGGATPLYGVEPRRRNGANRITADARTAAGTGVDINAARLRSTWLVAVMSSPVPLRTLLSAAGLRSARTVTDLAGYCPAPDPDQVQTLLASLPDTSLSRPERGGDA